jgi:hypothetical protein
MYCTTADGCWMLNMTGQPLWSVPQSTIDAALATACETSTGQVINAGQGTYGSSSIVVNCNVNNDNNMILMGYDEWGKTNEMPFSFLYQPVQGYDTNLCQLTFVWVDTGEFAYYGVFHDDGDGVYDNWNSAGFVNALSDNPGLPECVWKY